MYAKVIVDISHQEVDRLFDYIVPQAFEGFLERGMRVVVPFNTQERMGMVIELVDQSSDATKSIIEVLDVVPTLDEEQFMLLDYLNKTNLSLYQKMIETIIPSELLMDYQKVATALDINLVDQKIRPFFNQKNQWRLKKKDQIYQPILSRLKHKGIIKIEVVRKEKGSAKTETTYRYQPNHQYPKIHLYHDLVDLFSNQDQLTRKELIEKGISISRINTLTKHQVLEPFEQEVIRDIQHVFDLDNQAITLNKEQKLAVKTIKDHFHDEHIFLLHGITGSGKTEVYLDLIQEIIEKNQQVLILVPEILLIGPMAKRLKSRFEHVFIYHSGLSKGERYDQVHQISSHENAIVLGTRSASFLGLNHLGMIIMDEEHDDNYQQDEGVIYHARDILKLRANYHQIPLVLGSATPSIESMYHAKQGEYKLLTLTKRANQMKLPEIIFVDMKEELKAKNTSIFSNQLKENINDRLKKKEQVILLYNRKGYAPFVLCRQCGDVPKCPHCDVSLTYYKDKELLKCHYCGYEKPYQMTCAVCGENAVREIGVGINYVEQKLKQSFPEARILRLDRNVVQTKGSHEAIWHQFKEEKADILLGTQMIAKGLDFPKVTLVGVLMADLSLRVPSFMAVEKTYQLLTQITGRSGRFLPGQAIIQGYKLDHFAIQAVDKPYEVFYEEALYSRKLSNYEPFMHTAQILVSGISYLKTYQTAFLLKKRLTQKDVIILGPSTATIKKIKDHYRFTITLKYKNLDTNLVFNEINGLKKDDIDIRFYPILDIV